MTDHAFVLTAVRQANPRSAGAPGREGEWSTSELLLQLEQRSGTMQIIKRKTETTPSPGPSRRRGLLVGVAALVAVLIVGTVTWIALLNDEGPDVAGTPVDIARSFIEARDAWDAEAAIALLASDAVVRDEIRTVEELPALFDLLRAVDWRWTVGECTETATGAAAEVSCTYTHNNAWTRALGVEPVTGTFNFIVSDGEIAELNHIFNQPDFSPVFAAFTGWVGSNHLEDMDVMYNPVDGDYVLTPESIALWEQYTNEFVASVTESATP